jgi:hypothetical protein
VRLEVVPAVDPDVADALLPVLRAAGVLADADARPEPWRRAALDEALGLDEPAGDYAPSPRRTRGATRA